MARVLGQPARSGQADQPLERRALCMTGSRAIRRVPQAVAHGLQPPDPQVEFIGLGAQLRSVDHQPASRNEHGGDLVQREPGRLAQGDQRQPLQDRRLEQPAGAAPADGFDQSLVLVEADGGGPDAGTAGDFGDIEKNGLDLKLT
jgi:hypothetical protein